MNISAGTRLGPYEIVWAIGAGGMGEVWRARVCVMSWRRLRAVASENVHVRPTALPVPRL